VAEERGIWLHAVTRGADPMQLTGLTGVGGGPVYAVEADGLVAVVGSVGLDEFGQEPLRRNLEDLAWLETVARAHHHVVDTVARLGPVVPTRLATVYHDEHRLTDVLVRRHADFTLALDRVAGRDEWGVKVYVAPGAAVAEAAGGTAPAVAGTTEGTAPGGTEAGTTSGPGMAYLRRRRAQLSAGEEARRAALDGAEQVHAVLGRLVVAARRHAPQDRRLTGQSSPMVLNGAYLADTGRGAELAATVRDLAGRYPALRLELTGPWPPYSFASVGPGEPEPAGKRSG
jgi:hypothetical protein